MPIDCPLVGKMLRRITDLCQAFTVHQAITYLVHVLLCYAAHALALVFFVRFLPLAVTDQLTRFGPVFFRASAFVILFATFAGRHAGYGRDFFSLPDLPHFLPVLTSRQSSLNHFVSDISLASYRCTCHPLFCTRERYKPMHMLTEKLRTYALPLLSFVHTTLGL